MIDQKEVVPSPRAATCQTPTQNSKGNKMNNSSFTQIEVETIAELYATLVDDSDPTEFERCQITRRLMEINISGIVNVERFNALSEWAPALVVAIAKGQKRSVGELRKAVHEASMSAYTLNASLLATLRSKVMVYIKQDAKSLNEHGWVSDMDCTPGNVFKAASTLADTVDIEPLSAEDSAEYSFSKGTYVVVEGNLSDLPAS